jgi:hypothetical protein
MDLVNRYAELYLTDPADRERLLVTIRARRAEILERARARLLEVAYDTDGGSSE